jgi:hypothetical protein
MPDKPIQIQIVVENGQPTELQVVGLDENGEVAIPDDWIETGGPYLQVNEFVVDQLSALRDFVAEIDPCWDRKSPVPDGTYVFDARWPSESTLGSEVGVYHPDLDVPDPTIPAILGIFAFSLSTATYVQVFEPAYNDLNAQHIRSQHLADGVAWTRWLRRIAFTARAFKIIAECIIQDWLTISWRQFVFLILSLIFGSGVVRWLLAL